MSLATLIGVPFAVILAMQALSIGLTKRAPGLAVTLFPANGLAKEQVAFDSFQDKVKAGVSAEDAARANAPMAREALMSTPLAPRALAILAIAEANDKKRDAILDVGAQINKRDLPLQSLLLERALERGNYSESVLILDRILRVHPEYAERFFLPLAEAMADPETIPAFIDLLKDTAPWHHYFLAFAVTKPEAQVNLAQVRRSIVVDDKGLDRRLIRSLVNQQKFAAANKLYVFLSQVPDAASDKQAGRLSWKADYPPFDWSMTDGRHLRAQPSRDGRQLEIFARSGEGGVVAQRLLQLSEAGEALAFEAYGGTLGASGKLELRISCAISGELIQSFDIRPGRNHVLLKSLSANCDQIILAINARAQSGRPTFRAVMSTIAIETNSD